ncbi:putative peptidase S1, PA clan [Plasmopara halstedii]
MTRFSYRLAGIAALTYATQVDTQLASNISSQPTGVQKIDIGVGCGASATYPTYTDEYTTQPRFAYTISNRLAQFISVHFTNFNLPKNDFVKIRAANLDDEETTVLEYNGDDTSGQFFSTALQTTSIVVELYTQRTDPSASTQPVNRFLCLGFTIDSYRYLAQPANNDLSKYEEVCGADESQQAVCYAADPNVSKAAGAVARLLIHKSTGSYFCTGWLVGTEGHLITNNHCISQQAHASNTEFEFNAQGATCNTNCNKGLACGGQVRARTSTLINADATLDYALLKLPINLSEEYGFLQLREKGAVLSERIYIPQHPAGWGKHIAMKTDNGWGQVTSLNRAGCARDQVAYMLDTQGGSSGSPVIAWSDNAVIALHHCGGCPNTAINSYKLVDDMKARNILPENAVASGVWSPSPSSSPSTTSVQTLAPSPLPTLTSKTIVDGTITSTASFTSVDYVDFELLSEAAVELDILSMEELASGGYLDVNKDCNAGYINSSIVLFRVNSATGAMTLLTTNDDAPANTGTADGSISTADSYIYTELGPGHYRVAVSASGLTPAQAANKKMPLSSQVHVCDEKPSNYGNYRLTLSSSATLTIAGPNSYIGSQCNVSSPNATYRMCPYHREAALAYATGVEGSIIRSQSAVSVDHIPFKVGSFNRITIEVASYGSTENMKFVDVNGNCDSAYVDAVAYLFQANLAGLSAADVVNYVDDDDNFGKRAHYRSISFRDPYMSLALPAGDYILVVGRYPLSLEDAIARKSSMSVDKLTPQSCGKLSDRGNYLAIVSSAVRLNITSPHSFSGRRCPSALGRQVCPATMIRLNDRQ